MPVPDNRPDPEHVRNDKAAHKLRQHVEELLDQAIEESFPASDPPSIALPKDWGSEE
jgi:hypothetical protein